MCFSLSLCFSLLQVLKTTGSFLAMLRTLER